jgi:hypothetical protein
LCRGCDEASYNAAADFEHSTEHRGHPIYPYELRWSGVKTHAPDADEAPDPTAHSDTFGERALPWEDVIDE